MFLHIAGAHYDGKITQRRVVFEVAKRLRANGLLHISDDQEFDNTYEFGLGATGPKDSPIGQRILRSFESTDDMRCQIESHRKSYPCPKSLA